MFDLSIDRPGTSDTEVKRPDRYGGARPCKHLYEMRRYSHIAGVARVEVLFLKYWDYLRSFEFLGEGPLDERQRCQSRNYRGEGVLALFEERRRDDVQQRQFRPAWHGTNDICHFVIGCWIGDVEFRASVPHVGHQGGRCCFRESQGNIGLQIANLFHEEFGNHAGKSTIVASIIG